MPQVPRGPVTIELDTDDSELVIEGEVRSDSGDHVVIGGVVLRPGHRPRLELPAGDYEYLFRVNKPARFLLRVQAAGSGHDALEHHFDATGGVPLSGFALRFTVDAGAAA